jgi:hypothetical protein
MYAGWKPAGALVTLTVPVIVPGPHTDEELPTVPPLEPEQVTVEASRSLKAWRPKPEATSGSTVKNNTKLAATITPTRTF